MTTRIIRIERCNQCPYLSVTEWGAWRCIPPGDPILLLAEGGLPGAPDYNGHDVRAGVPDECPLEEADER